MAEEQGAVPRLRCMTWARRDAPSTPRRSSAIAPTGGMTACVIPKLEGDLPRQTAAERGGADGPGTIPPLTYLGYERTERTEMDIRRSIALEGVELAAAFAEADADQAAHRTTEALIFFLRRALASNDQRLTRSLFRHLYERCKIYFRGAVRGVTDPDARMDIEQEVLRRLTELLLRNDEKADFLEARFWLYMRKRVATECSSLAKRRRQEILASETINSDGDDALTLLDNVADPLLEADARYDLQAGLAALPADLRELFILRYMEEWPIDNTRGARPAAAGPSLAELYGISPRAVHKRLAKAERLLAPFRRKV